MVGPRLHPRSNLGVVFDSPKGDMPDIERGGAGDERFNKVFIAGGGGEKTD